MHNRLVTSPPVIMAPRADGFEVAWGVGRLCRGWVEWTADDDAGIVNSDAFGMVPQGDEVLRVRLAGFSAGTEVKVRAVTEAANSPFARHESEWKTVRTLEPAATEAHFAMWSDTHEHEEALRALDEATPEVDLLVWNGDLVADNWSGDRGFAATVLDPAGLDVSKGRPLLVSLGNHDVRGPWAFKLREFIATPEDRPYSAFRLGPVACIVLHTGEDKPDAHPTFEGRVAFEGFRKEQAEWLLTATARPEIRDAPYRIVFCHIPLRWKQEPTVDYEGGGWDDFSRMSRDAWHDALTGWGAQAILSGHMHETAWLPPAGIHLRAVGRGRPGRGPQPSGSRILDRRRRHGDGADAYGPQPHR